MNKRSKRTGHAHPDRGDRIIDAAVVGVWRQRVDMEKVVEYAEYGRNDGEEAGGVEEDRSETSL